MPTAQSTNATAQKQKNVQKVDNKIAKAVAKVEQGTTGTQEQQTSQAPSSGNKTPQEQPEFIKQSMIIIEKKVRNLEKRRAKLDEYKASKVPLNEDQKLAVSKYEEVVRTMELARELEKQFIALANDTMKQQKKQAKKEQLEREEAIRDRLKEAHKINSLLETFGEESVRNDFLNETNGAIRLTEQELNLLDEFNKLVSPTELGSKLETSSNESADHLLNTIEGRNKPITSLNQELVGQVTYSDVKKLFDRIFTSSYWTRETLTTEDTQETQEQTEQQNEQNLSEQVDNLNLNDQPVEQVQQEQHHEQTEQHVYQQNTSDDYVLVNQNDYHQDNTQQSQQQSKAYFTTLNPSTNINEFLQNNNEGINFLQDSEIQQQEQQQTQQQAVQQQQQNTQPQHQQGNFQGEGFRENRGGRGGHQHNGNRNYDQRRNYERRSGGGNYQPRGERGENSGPRNGSGGGGYRGGRGGYRGGYSNSGPRSGSGGNQYSRQPREYHNQQPVAQQ